MTLAAKSATVYFYPRSPRGERHLRGPEPADLGTISIHAPREGSDVLPAGGQQKVDISIHAPREGSDRSRL